MLTSLKKRKTFKVKRVARRTYAPISRLPDVGVKRVSSSLATYVSTNAGWAWVNLLEGIIQGVADNQRIGSRVAVKEVQLRFLISPQAALINVVRSVVVQDYAGDGNLLLANGTDVHDAAGIGQFTNVPLLCGFKDRKSLSSVTTVGRPNRFKLLSDRNKTVEIYGGVADRGQYHTVKYKFAFRTPFIINYASGSGLGTTAAMQQNLWWGTCASQAAGNAANIITPYWTVVYTDLS
jgi:hypothetical protein